jgi:phosphoribosylanthranilate isomerase
VTIVKICGVRDPEMALCALDAGADLIGMVFARSRRQISPPEAEAIARAVPDTRRLVGVFVNASAQDVQATVALYGLGYAQLSGDESAEYCRALGVPILRALRLSMPEDACSARVFAAVSDLIVLDAHVTGSYGGTGALANWGLAAGIAAEHRCLLAGGLNPANVGDAIRAVRPAGVDVSSGVEADGRKSPELIRRFIQSAREAMR